MSDDVFLFGNATGSNIEVIMDTMSQFSQISRLKVNMKNSSLIFPTKMSHMLRKSIASSYGLHTISCFGKYLGVDIRPKCPIR